MKPQTIFLPKEDPVRRRARAARLFTFLAELDSEKAWELVVRPFKRSRSNPQNSYERGVACVLIANSIGYDPDDVHEWLCGAYWGWKEVPCPKTPNNPRGVRDVPVRTTTTNEHGDRDVLSKQDYWDFVDFIQRFGAARGVYIPDPDPEYASRHEQQEQAA